MLLAGAQPADLTRPCHMRILGSISYAFRPLLDHLFVEADGLPGDSGPAEGLFYAPPPSISEALALVRILKQSIDLEGKIPRKLFGINWKTCDRILVEGN